MTQHISTTKAIQTSNLGHSNDPRFKICFHTIVKFYRIAERKFVGSLKINLQTSIRET